MLAVYVREVRPVKSVYCSFEIPGSGLGERGSPEGLALAGQTSLEDWSASVYLIGICSY